MLSIAQYVECTDQDPLKWADQHSQGVLVLGPAKQVTLFESSLPLGMELNLHQFKDPLLQLHCNFRFCFFPLSWLRNVWKNKTFYLCCGLFSFIMKNTKHSEKSGETITHVCEHVTHPLLTNSNIILHLIQIRHKWNETLHLRLKPSVLLTFADVIPSSPSPTPRSFSHHRFCYLEHSWASFYTSSTQICLCPTTIKHQFTCLERFHKWYTASVPLQFAPLTPGQHCFWDLSTLIPVALVHSF